MSRHKILIVDDDVVVLKALSVKLTTAGFTVFTAADGGSALALIRDIKPDLILLDVSFPLDVIIGARVAWDGILLMNWIHQTSNVGAPIIVITATGNAEVRAKAFAAGAAGFFQKPIGGDELLETIRKTLASSSSQETP